MEAVMRLTVWRFMLLCGVIQNVLAVTDKINPLDISNITCNLANGKKGICVNASLCHSNVINTDGTAILDLQYSDDCADYFLKCCSKESKCQKNIGICTPHSECEGLRYTDRRRECGGLVCCHMADNQTIATPEPSFKAKKCQDNKGICTPEPECAGLRYTDRRRECGGLVCCNMADNQAITTPEKSFEGKKCRNNKGICTPRTECEGFWYTDRRRECGGLVCCHMADNQTIATPEPSFEAKKCQDNKGICTPEPKCAGLRYIDQRRECGGLVCCNMADNQAITTPQPSFEAKKCQDKKGICTPEPKCAGLRYIDQRRECGGLVCCHMADNQAITTPEPSFEGKKCQDNKGICTPEPKCAGLRYTDRRRECGGLVCCHMADNQTITTPEPSFEGKKCQDNKGICTPEPTCAGLRYIDQKRECGGLVCCNMADNQAITTSQPSFEGKKCQNNKGTCTPKTECEGFRYTDRRRECGGLVCCNTADNQAITTPQPSFEGTKCQDNKGICTPEPKCAGLRYTDRRRECGGLVCCHMADNQAITTPEKSFERKKCRNNIGICTLPTECEGLRYTDRRRECGGLVCCGLVS